MKLSVYAVDDEPLALRRLELLLERLPDVELVGTARNGREAIGAMRTIGADVLLLDIRMAGLDGFDVVEALTGPKVPLIIFVTAYDHFAVRAFEISAVDYIVKPVELDRLRDALARARHHLESADAKVRVGELRDAIAVLRGQPPAEAARRYETQIWTERRNRFVPVKVGDIDWIEAERDYVRLHVGGESYLLRETIGAMETRLDPEQYARVRRSALVRRDRIEAIRRAGYGDYRVQLRSGNEVRVGRTYVKSVRALLAPR